MDLLPPGARLALLFEPPLEPSATDPDTAPYPHRWDLASYIKFGVIRPGNNAGENFERLLDACEALAATLGAQLLTAGANMGRHEAYRAMRKQGFRTDIQGVAMQRSNDPGYHVHGVYIIDDWR